MSDPASPARRTAESRQLASSSDATARAGSRRNPMVLTGETAMTTEGYTTKFPVDRTPEQAFDLAQGE